MYAIGAFAKLTGATPKALYLYERHGLIQPRRTRAGYRRYTMRELHQLSRVLALKTLGLSLQEIARLGSGSGAPTRVNAEGGCAALHDVLSRRCSRILASVDRVDHSVPRQRFRLSVPSSSPARHRIET